MPDTVALLAQEEPVPRRKLGVTGEDFELVAGAFAGVFLLGFVVLATVLLSRRKPPGSREDGPGA